MEERKPLPVDDITLFCTAGASVSMLLMACLHRQHSFQRNYYLFTRIESKHIPTERYDRTKEWNTKKLLQRTLCGSVYDRIGSYHQMSAGTRTHTHTLPNSHSILGHCMCEYIDEYVPDRTCVNAEY